MSKKDILQMQTSPVQPSYYKYKMNIKEFAEYLWFYDLISSIK